MFNLKTVGRTLACAREEFEYQRRCENGANGRAKCPLRLLCQGTVEWGDQVTNVLGVRRLVVQSISSESCKRGDTEARIFSAFARFHKVGQSDSRLFHWFNHEPARIGPDRMNAFEHLSACRLIQGISRVCWTNLRRREHLASEPGKTCKSCAGSSRTLQA
jgi:hypothetical protein